MIGWKSGWMDAGRNRWTNGWIDAGVIFKIYCNLHNAGASIENLTRRADRWMDDWVGK